jgi:hypothetical protein
MATFAAASWLIAANPLAAQPKVVSFELHPNPKFIDCIRDPYNSAVPRAKVTVLRGELNDFLQLSLENFKPGLAFDLFTVQRSLLLNDGAVDPKFTNFGFAWYQSDVEVDSKGKGEVQIKTILLDDIFGFDPDASVPPINTFHVGFWFDNPHDAAACGFDPTKPTPFNGQHKAGPLAMISVPDPHIGVGPLCTDPKISGTSLTCGK